MTGALQESKVHRTLGSQPQPPTRAVKSPLNVSPRE